MTMELSEFLVLAILELLGAAAGVYWGYTMAINQDRQVRKNTDLEDERKVVESLLGEISWNESYLNKGIETREIEWGSSKTHAFETFWYKLSDGVFQSIKASGKLFLLSTKTMMYLNAHYIGVARMNELTLRVQSKKFGPYELNEIKIIYKGLIDSLTDIKKALRSDTSNLSEIVFTHNEGEASTDSAGARARVVLGNEIIF